MRIWQQQSVGQTQVSGTLFGDIMLPIIGFRVSGRIREYKTKNTMEHEMELELCKGYIEN